MHCRWSWFQWILDRPKFTEPEIFLIILETTYAWSVYTEMALRYREFAKGEFRLQPYLLKLAAINRVSICKLRICSLKLPIETRRWRNIPSGERFCTLCEDQLIGNEFHYLFVCKNPINRCDQNIFRLTSLMYTLIMKCTVYCRTVIYHFWIDYLYMIEKHHHCFETCQ